MELILLRDDSPVIRALRNWLESYLLLYTMYEVFIEESIQELKWQFCMHHDLIRVNYRNLLQI